MRTAFSARLRSLDSSDGQEEATDGVRAETSRGKSCTFKGECMHTLWGLFSQDAPKRRTRSESALLTAVSSAWKKSGVCCSQPLCSSIGNFFHSENSFIVLPDYSTRAL